MQTFKIKIGDKNYVWDPQVEGLLRGESLIQQANWECIERDLGIRWDSIPEENISFLTFWMRKGEGIFPETVRVKIDGDPPMLRLNGGYLFIREDIYEDLKEKISQYPLLDEDLYSEREFEEVQRTWEDFKADEVKEDLCERLGLDEEWLDENFPDWEEVLFGLALKHGEIIVDGGTAYIEVVHWKDFIRDFKEASGL